MYGIQELHKGIVKICKQLQRGKKQLVIAWYNVQIKLLK